MNLSIFQDKPFIDALKDFFGELKVPVNYVSDEPTTAQEILKDTYKDNDTFKLVGDVFFVGMVDDAAFEGNASLDVAKIESDYDGILIFGVTLKKRPNGHLPTRSQLAEISRAFNREYHFTPVVVVFRYAGDQEQYIAFANTERLKYKQEWREGEKAGKVSLLRDVSIKNPHSGHVRILSELIIPTTGTKAVDSFAKLYAYWQEVFSVSVLNKKFYQELSNWYFWALKHVTFPGKPTPELAHKKNAQLDDLIQEHNATNVIRLLTRLLFTWFIKEKQLIPEALFDLKALQKDILEKITPYHEKGLFTEANKDSIYYKAILQNLFFASLNCPIEADGKDNRVRGFRGEGYGTHRGIDYLMRYKKYFKNPDAFLQMMNQTVPFLNGGLFECLDDKYQNIYIDGFSDQMAKGEQLFVPDYLFFGVEEETDLSDVTGISDKKYKQAAVKGLINILRSYKFTITENTPIEEDVALDPELLGKVFENLLASYNPETKTTARKQTGSFYTPREIVNYMVDESLIAYLKNKILEDKSDAFLEFGKKQFSLFGNEVKKGQAALYEQQSAEFNGKDEKLDKLLHDLVSFDPGNPFRDFPKATKAIIEALDECKILDPACGSGAFPMGVLQKMVHILQKLDPDNKLWKEVQRQKVLKETEEAFDIEDRKEREEKLIEINNAFDQRVNDPDYARKLYLIENCIYGVDIQPIAIQISKLRFFISLVVDQKVNPQQVNFGIRPLPNLETKFVAANTLIDIEKPKAQTTLFDTKEIKKLEAELKKVRHKLFSARTKDTKLKYREQDEELRNAIAEELKLSGWQNDTAEKLAQWDPYDQNASSSFFDPEWMFDITNGFDVVIGNPPYGANFSKFEKIYLKEVYYSMEGDFESYIYFFEKGFRMAATHGILCYITPNNFLMQWFSGKIRELILKRKILQIVDLGFDVFESAVVPTCIMITENIAPSTHLVKFKTQVDLPFQNKFNIINQSEFSIMPKNQINLKLTPTNLHIYHKIINNSLPLGQVTEIKIGIECKPEFITETKETEIHKPLVRGRNFDRFILDFESDPKYVFYKKELLHRPREERLFLADEKILIRQTGDQIIAALDNEKLYAWKSVFVVLSHDPSLDLKFVLSILNSKLINYFYSLIVGEVGRTFAQVKGVNLERIPIKQTTTENQKLHSLFADFISWLKLCNKNSSVFEETLNALVFNLYFPDHMKEREINVLEYVERDINTAMQGREFDKMSDSDKELVIEALHAKWSHPDNQVRNRIKLFAVRSPEILKPILES